MMGATTHVCRGRLKPENARCWMCGHPIVAGETYIRECVLDYHHRYRARTVRMHDTCPEPRPARMEVEL